MKFTWLTFIKSEEYDLLELVSFNISLYNHILWGLSQHFLLLGRVLVSKWGLRPNTKAQVSAPHNPYSQKQKLFFSLLVHIYCYTSSSIFPPSLPLYLPTTFYFTVKLLSCFPLSFILTFLLLILFCVNLKSFHQFNPYFSTQKLWVLSLSLSLSLLVDFFSFL